ncbi:hypothetical protein FGO68_gene17259 [Halteria grandinella]|uniref:Uncharacterized protein n=1 Tax=Halteria grandinella TaxID=5974 RepID=A0A8J8NK23_HALGN|nr:hypothetical protein FGO68_gene17259 [Halteria grandinella]
MKNSAPHAVQTRASSKLMKAGKEKQQKTLNVKFRQIVSKEPQEQQSYLKIDERKGANFKINKGNLQTLNF